MLIVGQGKKGENLKMSNINTENNGKIQPPKKGDKVDVIRILILAVVSFVLGFGLVIFFLGPSDTKLPDDLPDLSGKPTVATVDATEPPVAEESTETPDNPPATGYASTEVVNNPLLPATAEQNAPSVISNDSSADPESTATRVDEAAAPPEVPPGRTPDNVTLDGNAFYLKCWDGNGAETPGESCDRLSVFEKRVATRLYVVDRCKLQHTDKKSAGKLSLGVEVDFEKSALSFWNGPSSTLENAAKIATCLRSELNGLPIQGVSHKYARYRMFYTVLFGDPKRATVGEKSESAAPAVENPAKNLPIGKTVTVLKDQVRVRKSPVDGDVIGKIAKDNQVKLLKKKGEWCQVMTPNNNEGWMICEALSK